MTDIKETLVLGGTGKTGRRVAEPSVPTAIVESIGGRASHTRIAMSMPDMEHA